MINKVIIGGRMVADPEMRRTSTGVACTTFRLAVERDYKPKDSEGSTVDYINFVSWRSTAEFIAKYFGKGRMIICEGAIQQREYTNKEGQKRQVHEINVDKCWFGDSKREKSYSDAEPSDLPNYAEASGNGMPEVPGDFAILEDDGNLPF